jgi:hypothetical protein
VISISTLFAVAFVTLWALLLVNVLDAATMHIALLVMLPLLAAVGVVINWSRIRSYYKVKEKALASKADDIEVRVI